MSATSSTLRAIGPTVSSVGTSGKTPSVEISPHCDFSPTTSQAAEGSRIEQPVSEPSASSQRPAASAAAEPDDEPPVVFPGCAGLWHVPYHWLWPEHAPGELRQVRLADEHGARVEQSLHRRRRSARGRGPRRGRSRRSCGSPAVSKRSLTASVLPESGPVAAAPRLDARDERVPGVVRVTARPRRTRSRPSRPATARRGTSTSVDAGRVAPKTSCRTGLISGRSSTSVRKTVTLTTSSNPQPPAARTARMFSNTCRVCATTSSPPTSRPSPSTATIPDT